MALRQLLERLEGVQTNGKGHMALCPAHNDRAPSLSVGEGDDGRVLLKCFAGCTTESVVEALDLSLADLFEKRNGDTRGLEGGSDSPTGTSSTVEPGSGCTLEAYAAAKKLPVAFLRDLGLVTFHYVDRPAVRMPYLDVEGSEEVCVRFRVAMEGDGKVKTKRGQKGQPYGLWRLAEARKRGYVVIVEGESDSQTAWHHGVPALGVPGATSWKGPWAEYLEGIEKVYAVVEPDKGGEALWERLAASPLRERLHRVSLDGFKDLSALHLSAPDNFVERFGRALDDAVAWLDIAETEAQERTREAWRRCETLAREPFILDRFAVDFEKCGVVGEMKAARLIYLALNSRHCGAKHLVNVAVKGPSSAGKTHLVEKVLEFVPEDAYHFLTAMSERALAYSEVPLERRFLILAEAAGMSGEFQTYLIRSLLSEGRLRYETVEKTREGLKARVIEREGPTGLVVTTTLPQLHHENETRMLTIRADDSPEHTRAVLAAIAREDVESPDLSTWHALQVWIAGGETRVTIPYAATLARMIPPVAVRLRRDFSALLNLIRSHALLHRADRERDVQGRIVATLKDYTVARDLVADLISAGVDATVPGVVRETVETVRRLNEGASRDGVTMRQVADALHLGKSSTLYRVRLARSAGYLLNLEEGKGRPARLVLGDPMPEDLEILPTTEHLRRAERGSTVRRFREC